MLTHFACNMAPTVTGCLSATLGHYYNLAEIPNLFPYFYQFVQDCEPVAAGQHPEMLTPTKRELMVGMQSQRPELMDRLGKALLRVSNVEEGTALIKFHLLDLEFKCLRRAVFG